MNQFGSLVSIFASAWRLSVSSCVRAVRSPAPPMSFSWSGTIPISNYNYNHKWRQVASPPPPPCDLPTNSWCIPSVPDLTGAQVQLNLKTFFSSGGDFNPGTWVDRSAHLPLEWQDCCDPPILIFHSTTSDKTIKHCIALHLGICALVQLKHCWVTGRFPL